MSQCLTEFKVTDGENDIKVDMSFNPELGSTKSLVVSVSVQNEEDPITAVLTHVGYHDTNGNFEVKGTYGETPFEFVRFSHEHGKVNDRWNGFKTIQTKKEEMQRLLRLLEASRVRFDTLVDETNAIEAQLDPDILARWKNKAELAAAAHDEFERLKKIALHGVGDSMGVLMNRVVDSMQKAAEKSKEAS